MARVLIPIPDIEFDPTETGVPWRTLRQRGHYVVFATPNGKLARADPRMVTGEGLGIFAALMRADNNGRSAYQEMRESEEFRHPISYGDIRPETLDGIILPGGHAKGMREHLESDGLQSVVATFFARNQPLGDAAKDQIAARKLAVLLHRMWIDGTEFNWSTKNIILRHHAEGTPLPRREQWPGKDRPGELDIHTRN